MERQHDNFELSGEPKPGRLNTAVFAIIAFTAAISVVLFGAVDSVTWIVLTFVWVVAAVLITIEAMTRGVKVSLDTLQLPIVGLLLIGVIQLLPLGSVPVDGLTTAASSTLSADPYATRLFVLKLAVFVFFFAACLSYIDSDRRLKILLYGIVAFGAVMAFYGIMQRLANPDGIYGLRETPQAIPFGPYVNQHHFASLMLMTGGLAASVVFSDRIGRNTRFACAAALVIMGSAVVFTSSRGGLLGFGAMIGLVAFFKLARDREAASRSTEARETLRHRATVFAGLIALTAVIVGVVLFLGAGDSLLRGTGVVNADADFSSGRFHFWPIALTIFFAHPILGAGFDAFAVSFTQHDTRSGLFRVEQAHNDYLQILADAGIVGFIFVAAFIVLLFKKGVATVAATRGTRRAAAIGALAGCFGLLIHSFFDFPLRTFANSFFFLILVTMATVNIDDHDTPASEPNLT
jgi:O-antigen ligase